MQHFIENFVWLIPALPLLGFVLNGMPTALRVKLPRSYVYTVASGVMLLAFCLAVGVFCTLKGMPPETRSFTNTLWPWMHIGALKVNAAFLIDPLSSTMMLIITGIGFLIHIYSTGYMAEDKGYARFFSYLNLFCFMMLVLVMGDNLFMLFVGWEGVGLCSYLLIGFWFEHKPNGVAGMKAFLVNRVGDFGMMIGLMTMFWLLHSAGQATLTFVELKTAVASLSGMTVMGISAATFICVFLFIGATGKSAQIPLYVWLPDAMAGPTPVSALIHAATMVTAGVYMIARLNFLFAMSPDALAIIATIGAATAFMGATIGFAQNDIKKVLAYSTVSQLGFMFVAMGSGAYVAGVFHLMTHAFFKACLFLGSGSVIMGMHHEQDMRLMGGLRKYMPVTFWTFMLATIAIGGIFPFSGFFSKDEILWQAFSQGGARGNWYYLVWGVSLAAAMGTAFYMMRCVTMTFFGELRANKEDIKKIIADEKALAAAAVAAAALAVAVDTHDDHGHDDHAHTAHAAHATNDTHVTHVDHHDDHAHGHHGPLVPHEQPWNVTLPLVVLALLATFGGFLNVPFALNNIFGGHGNGLFSEWLAPVIPQHAHHEVHAIEYVFMIKSVVLALVFMYLGYLAYTRHGDKIKKFVATFPNLYKTVYNKYFVDEFYQSFFVNGVLKLNNLCAAFDRQVVDGVVNLVGSVSVIYSKVIGWCDGFFVDGAVNMMALATERAGNKLKRLQSGNIQHYAYGAVMGVVVVLVIKILM